MKNTYFSEAIKKEIKSEWSKKTLDTVQIIAWSDSDFSKMTELFIWLNKAEVSYWLNALSAHRTPWELEQLVSSLPKIYLPENVSPKARELYGKTNLNIRVILATAWLSAHLAWVIAAQTQTPVLALPWESSSSWITDSTPSMVNMPPGIPNGFVANPKIALSMLEKIMKLEKSDCDILYVEENLLHKTSIELLELLWIKYTTNQIRAKIWIQKHNIDVTHDFVWKVDVPIVIPTWVSKIDSTYAWYFIENLQFIEWLTMWYNIDKKANIKNAIIFAAQIFWIFNKEIVDKLNEYRTTNNNQVVDKNNKLIEDQLSYFAS